jgi:phosphatidylglycerophosphatase A|tara:strand:- start:86 stop:526 length:441 start_codon:yes stop_codon:yes gene_type:complete
MWLSLLGLGFSKFAPGTVGSMFSAVLWWFFLSSLSLEVQLFSLIIYCWVSIHICDLVMKQYELRDPSEVVADEFAGMWLALMFLPNNALLALFSFIVFRLLDIVKPSVIGWLDREVHGGLGVMADDLLAGAVTALIIGLPVFLFGG